MKKLVTLVACLAFLLVAMPVMAVKPGNPGKAPDKVEVCHVIEANDVVHGFWGAVDLHFGKVISVSENAVDAHLAHDDDTVFSFGQGPIDQFISVGFHLPAANCWVNKPMAN